MKRCAVLFAAAALVTFAAGAAGRDASPFEASPDGNGLLVVDLHMRFRTVGLADGLRVDQSAIVSQIAHGPDWDLTTTTAGASIAGLQVFAVKPGRYHLFFANSTHQEGTMLMPVQVALLDDPTPQLAVEVAKGEVAYVGAVKVDVFPMLPHATPPKVTWAPDAEDQQKQLEHLAKQAKDSPWAARISARADPGAIAAAIAAARALPANTGGHTAAPRAENFGDELDQAKALSVAAVAAAARSPREGRRPSDRLLFIMSGNKQGLIDTLGRVVVEPEFDWTGSSSEERSMVARDGLTGFVDGTGRMVIDPKWQSAFSFNDGLAIVETGVKYGHNREVGQYRESPGMDGWIDRDGNVAITPQWAEVQPFSEGCAWVSDGKLWGVIDRKGNYRITPRFAERPTGRFSEGLCPVWLGAPKPKKNESEEQFGYIDTTGAIVIPAQFGAAASFSEGVAAVMKGNKTGFIDRSGRVIIEPRFDRSLSGFSEGLAAVCLDGGYGFIDASGKVVIEPRYQAVYAFHDGMAVARIGDKAGFIDKAGRMVIEPQFNRADSFEDGIARVELRPGLWGYIRRDGSFIWNPVAGH